MNAQTSRVIGIVVGAVSTRFGLVVTGAGIAALGALGPGALTSQEPPRMREQNSGTAALLQAVSPVTEQIVWASGHSGAVLRSLDGGESWALRPVQTLDSLQFRDVYGFDADRAVVLSAGEGDQSRIYRTGDGGATWSLSWINEEPEGFYDCLDFWDERRGVVYGDAVNGELRILLTDDGGASWSMVPAASLPPAVPGEGGFAASGTCTETGPDGRAWIGTGAGTRPRVLRTDDYGATWVAGDLPIVAGEAAGAFTIVFADAERGIVMGGDLSDPDGFSDNVAATADGGVSWVPGTRTPFAGAVYGGALTGSGLALTAIAVGPGGLAITDDLGAAWRVVDTRSFWAVGSYGNRAWAVGPEGRVLRLDW